jgi:hypothetical protein
VGSLFYVSGLQKWLIVQEESVHIASVYWQFRLWYNITDTEQNTLKCKKSLLHVVYKQWLISLQDVRYVLTFISSSSSFCIKLASQDYPKYSVLVLRSIQQLWLCKAPVPIGQTANSRFYCEVLWQPRENVRRHRPQTSVSTDHAASPWQHPVSHFCPHPTVSGKTQNGCHSPPTIIPWFDTLWLLPISKNEIEAERTLVWYHWKDPGRIA